MHINMQFMYKYINVQVQIVHPTVHAYASEDIL